MNQRVAAERKESNNDLVLCALWRTDCVLQIAAAAGLEICRWCPQVAAPRTASVCRPSVSADQCLLVFRSRPLPPSLAAACCGCRVDMPRCCCLSCPLNEEDVLDALDSWVFGSRQNQEVVSTLCRRDRIAALTRGGQNIAGMDRAVSTRDIGCARHERRLSCCCLVLCGFFPR